MATYDLEDVSYDAAGARVAIVAARFNHAIVQLLLDGAVDCLQEHGIADADVEVVRVPGAFEIPLTAKRLAATGRYDTIVTVGAVVRGGTPHFEYVAGECARGVSLAALDTGVPIIFGVLTVDDMMQARARAGGAEGNKGREAALAGLEMVTVIRRIDDSSGA